MKLHVTRGRRMIGLLSVAAGSCSTTASTIAQYFVKWLWPSGRCRRHTPRRGYRADKHEPPDYVLELGRFRTKAEVAFGLAQTTCSV